MEAQAGLQLSSVIFEILALRILSSRIASMHHHFGSGLDALQNVERCLPCDCIWVVGFVEEDHSFNPIMPRAHAGSKACHCRQC